jgi:preprotein translocase subunit SecG
MTYFLYGLFFLSCIVLIITVLLQPGKSDAGALFTSSTSSNAFGSRGTATVLSKTTIVTATIFMLSALMLSMPALNGGASVLTNNPDSPETTVPVTTTNANVDTNQPGLNTNSAVQVPPITNLNSSTTSNAATNATGNTSNAAANTANKATNTAKQTNTTKANTNK